MKYVEACNSDNAIKHVAFALEFIEPINDAVVTDLLLLHKTNSVIIDNLPGIQQHKKVTFELASPAGASSAPDGVTFDCTAPDGTKQWAVSVRSNSLIVNCGSYTRWKEVWCKAKEYMAIILSVLPRKTFNIVALEYFDEFTVKDGNAAWKEELLNFESIYLPRNVYGLNTFWHSHHGFFQEDVTGIDRKVLNNVNISYSIDDDASYKIKVKTQHRAQLDLPVIYSDDFFDSVVNDVITDHHNVNKMVMSDIFSKKACSQINLEV